MINQEDLERIKQANSIINRASRRLGFRPLYINSSNHITAKPKNRLGEIAKQLKKTATNFPKNPPPLTQKISLKESKPNKQGISLGSAVTSIIALLIVFVIVFSVNPVDISKEIIDKFQQKKEAIIPVQAQSNTAFDSGLIITSGIYAKKSVAQKKLKELKDRLGVPLKLVQVDDFFTIQIGPSYDKHEDALLVFDELSRYSVGSLSIRFR